MTELLESLKALLPYAAGALALLVVGLFAMYRSDNIRAGESYPTKLAVAQTFSTMRNARALLALLRGTKPAEPPAPREFKSLEEMKATITPGTLRASDIPPLPTSRRSPAKTEAPND